MCAAASCCNSEGTAQKQREKNLRTLGLCIFVIESAVAIMIAVEYFGFWKWVVPEYKNRSEGTSIRSQIERRLLVLEQIELCAVVFGLVFVTYRCEKLGRFYLDVTGESPSTALELWINGRDFLHKFLSVVFGTLVYYFGLNSFIFPGAILPIYLLTSGTLLHCIYRSFDAPALMSESKTDSSNNYKFQEKNLF